MNFSEFVKDLETKLASKIEEELVKLLGTGMDLAVHINLNAPIKILADTIYTETLEMHVIHPGDYSSLDLKNKEYTIYEVSKYKKDFLN